MAPRRQASEKSPPSVDLNEETKPMSPASKKAARRAQILEARKRRGSQLNNPAIQAVLAVMSALLLFVIVRPYYKSSPLYNVESPPLKAPFKKTPVVINNKGNTGQTAYVVAEIPGKGKGIIAARDIKEGELVMTDKPLLLLPRETSEESPTVFIQRQISSFTQSDARTYLSLSYPEGTPEDQIPLAIAQTNAFSAGKDGMGIFPKAARLNHGCSSAFNVVYSYREQEERLYIHAIRDIRQGEELLTAYFNTKQKREDRRAYLQSQYHFHCNCPVCALPDSQSNISDMRLNAMKSHYDRLATWNDGEIDGRQAIQMINSIWGIGQQEGYHSERGQLAADAALVATAHSDEVAAMAWRELAAKWFRIEIGNDTEQVKLNVKWAEDPVSHPAWNKKEAMVVGGPDPSVMQDGATREDVTP